MISEGLRNRTDKKTTELHRNLNIDVYLSVVENGKNMKKRTVRGENTTTFFKASTGF